ncbi:MAG: hypothetical protein MUD08_09445 [Cytophagales bacterium]|jgi:hypothetical protein|nr:hypothetical protein [Cytophagales bacterium]
MTLFKFDEVLNDLMDYFILGDPDCLLKYKTDNGLPDDLLTHFTATETGDEVVEKGIIVPLAGVNNMPYTIYFNLSDNAPELLREDNQLQVRQDGYCLKVEHGRLYLFTMPYLKKFTPEIVEKLKISVKTSISVPNGWYSVSVLGGQTKQETEILDREGQKIKWEGFEPTFEFVIRPSDNKPLYSADISYFFTIE